jgi:hypothetical protein
MKFANSTDESLLAYSKACDDRWPPTIALGVAIGWLALMSGTMPTS